MEKKNAKPIVASKAGASKAIDCKAGASKAVDCKAVASVLDSLPATDDAAGTSAAAGGMRNLPEWDPYEELPYIRPANPYDTSLPDPWTAVESSDVGSDDEDRHTKAREVMRRLQTGQYASYFANDVYTFPFCIRKLAGTDFNCLMTHAEDISSCNPKVGETVNVNAFHAKHKALDIHLYNLQRVAIAAGRMALIKPKVPKIKGQGSKKWRKRHMECA